MNLKSVLDIPPTPSKAQFKCSQFSYGKTEITFHIYYDDKSPIYFELEPFMKLINFTEAAAAEILQKIPGHWIAKAREFKEISLPTIDPNKMFCSVEAIMYLFSMSEKKDKPQFLQKVLDMCVMPIQHQRNEESRKRIIALEQVVENLVSQHEKHHSKFEILGDFLDTLKAHQSEILEVVKGVKDALL
jgi:hypothetical protein